MILSEFQIVLPAHRVAQADANAWTLGRACENARQNDSSFDPELQQKLFGRYAIKSSLIEHRHFDSVDTGRAQTEEGDIYRIDEKHPNGGSIGDRARFFHKRASDVLREFYDENETRMSQLIHVTCTGYRSPSAAQCLVAEKGWTDVGVTHAYHMGCYAAFPAIRIASGFVATGKPGNRVDLVHNEMCALHLNSAARSPEQIVVQSLFADGHVKYSASNEASSGLRLLALEEAILPDSEGDMSWVPEEWGLQMTLSREVPAKIRGSISGFFRRLCQSSGHDPARLQKEAIFAVHPGGPKIIQAVEQAMEISPEQTFFSRKVLRERGNMSSATLPHIWREIIDSRPPSGTIVVSYAFGPGLTIFGAIFEVV